MAQDPRKGEEHKMARYTGPKDRLSRREGFDLFGSGLKLTRLTVPPGVHGPKGTRGSSQYGKQLREKQKVKRKPKKENNVKRKSLFKLQENI